MKAYLKSIDVWSIIESGWKCPNKTMAEWAKEEKTASIGNDKTMDAIFLAISVVDEFSRICQ
jgi:hypothetical protein